MPCLCRTRRLLQVGHWMENLGSVTAPLPAACKRGTASLDLGRRQHLPVRPHRNLTFARCRRQPFGLRRGPLDQRSSRRALPRRRRDAAADRAPSRSRARVCRPAGGARTGARSLRRRPRADQRAHHRRPRSALRAAAAALRGRARARAARCRRSRAPRRRDGRPRPLARAARGLRRAARRPAARGQGPVPRPALPQCPFLRRRRRGLAAPPACRGRPHAGTEAGQDGSGGDPGARRQGHRHSRLHAGASLCRSPAGLPRRRRDRRGRFCRGEPPGRRLGARGGARSADGGAPPCGGRGRGAGLPAPLGGGGRRRRGAMSSLDLAVIGNCTYGALVDAQANIVWCCLPRFDSDPVFCSLLDDDESPRHGFFSVELEGFRRSEQQYRRNSAVLVTRLYDDSDGVVEVTDFAPRFTHFGRSFRPASIVRHLRPLAGSPRVRLRVRPAYDYGRGSPEVTRGSNHLRYVMPGLTLRLTTDAPVTYVAEEVPFILDRPLSLVLGPDESLTAAVDEISREFFRKTDAYWREWTRYLALPFEWQEAVIRAAITLKLCNFEETGAIIAAMTTSIPEAPHSGRNWDYRYCWLRDAFFVVHALNRLGATKTMEGYLNYISNIVSSNEQATAEGGHLQPVFGIALDRKS